ncbi:DNA-directed RNA polymerase subunit K [Candidatus Pacearchaeota archaeon]|nr:DNA-directed RNA polymerase subunit K [Candidatus Pacearchaeota archaeon]
MIKQEFTKYERARILGARALQIAMNAPVLVKITKEDLEKIRYDPLKIAEAELDSGILPISVHRPQPKMKEAKLKRVRDTSKLDDNKVIAKEGMMEEEIAKEGEIMELANPEDEVSSEVDSEGEVGEE